MERELAIGYARDFAAAVRRFMDTEAVYLFGPYAEGTEEEDSDIDVAVVVRDVPREYTDQDTELVLWSMAQGISEKIDPVLLFTEGTSQDFLKDLQQKGESL